MKENQSVVQTEQQPFRSAMFCLFPETIRNMALLSNEQLGEITRALFVHYWEPDKGYTGKDPTMMILYNFASGEMDRYTEKCRRNAKNGSQSKASARTGEANPKRDEANRERNAAQGQDQGQSQSQNQIQNQNQIQDQVQKPAADRNREPDMPPAPCAHEVQEEFACIWTKYPNKQGRDAALRAYEKARASGVTQQEVQAGLERYLVYLAETPGAEIRKGSTWFIMQCWKKENERLYKGKLRVSSA